MGLFLLGAWFSSWYDVSIDTGHIAQSPQSSPRWSPAFKIEPVLFLPSTPSADEELWLLKNSEYRYGEQCVWRADCNLDADFPMRVGLAPLAPELFKGLLFIGEGNGNPLQYSCLETPWTEKPGRLQSLGSKRVGHD